MKLLELSTLFYLSTLSLTVKSFSLTHPSRTTIQSSTDSSLCASRNQPDLTRAASFIVGSTIPFLFSLGQDEMKSNQLNLQFGQQHAAADSTGKVHRLWHSYAMHYSQPHSVLRRVPELVLFPFIISMTTPPIL